MTIRRGSIEICAQVEPDGGFRDGVGVAEAKPWSAITDIAPAGSDHPFDPRRTVFIQRFDSHRDFVNQARRIKDAIATTKQLVRPASSIMSQVTA